MTTTLPISDELIAEQNAKRSAGVLEDYEALGRKLQRDNIDIEAITKKVADFSVAVMI